MPGYSLKKLLEKSLKLRKHLKKILKQPVNNLGKNTHEQLLETISWKPWTNSCEKKKIPEKYLEKESKKSF